MFKKMNPFRLILSWLVLTMVITVISMIILGLSSPGGEQRPFTFLGRAIPIIVYGVLIIAIVSVPFYLEWVKKYWYVNLFLIIACTAFLFKDLSEKNKDPYYKNMKTVIINGKNYEQTTEYYDSKSKKIRSISFYSNGRKDSIWTVFTKDGSIIRREQFKDGVLINIHQ